MQGTANNTGGRHGLHFESKWQEKTESSLPCTDLVRQHLFILTKTITKYDFTCDFFWPCMPMTSTILIFLKEPDG